MIIEDLILGKYISRPNRFTVTFKNEENNIEIAHLHDPGRLKELLIEDTPILLRYVPTYNKTGRKTKYDVIGIYYDDEWLLLNSSFHNKLVQELIDNKEIPQLKDFHIEKPEYTYGKSRLDFLLKNDNNDELFLEVKGCTLVIDGEARFPDAPTSRGKKHVEELINIKRDGKLSCIIILILQNKAEFFTPNYDTDPDFSLSLEEAYNSGVQILPTHIITRFEGNTLKLYYNQILPLYFR
ncbi:MAG: DNA/RNA nuclease SfsA [Methanosphaera sp.]|nr:DNA/RNA nuclease SfsA [Methanosphaera sp.]